MAENANEQAKSVKKANERELDIAYEGGALAVNRFFITVSGPIVRVAFAEQANTEVDPVFRTAVSMSVTDALDLANALKQLLSPMILSPAEAQNQLAALSIKNESLGGALNALSQINKETKGG